MNQERGGGSSDEKLLNKNLGAAFNHCISFPTTERNIFICIKIGPQFLCSTIEGVQQINVILKTIYRKDLLDNI